MITTHSLGFPRIGKKRELKFALEKYWHQQIDQDELQQTATKLRQQHWQDQAALDFVPVGDFSFYDQILDSSFLLGNIPYRVNQEDTNELDNYFRLARGRSADDSECNCIKAGEMTKWFDTNYHYIVPEFDKDTHFSVNPDHLINQIKQAKLNGFNPKPVIIGPVSYLWLGKSKDETDKLTLLDQLLPVYRQLLSTLASLDVEWVQIDEPILVTELSKPWQLAITKAYSVLQQSSLKLLLATYFGELQENLDLTCKLPINGLHIDAINAKSEVDILIDKLPKDTVLSLGIINARNIWKTDLTATLDWLEPIYKQLQHRLWLAPSCSLLHVPVDLESEQQWDDKVKPWLAFAVQKLEELTLIVTALKQGRKSVALQLTDNAKNLSNRKKSGLVNDKAVKKRIKSIDKIRSKRNSCFPFRAEIQSKKLKLPLYPTTTIGSFPQTNSIRKIRHEFRLGLLSYENYRQAMNKEIESCIREQESLGLDVLVHGEAERNDMVEYFGEQLNGFLFTQFGWVQSYGSRCVKPPIIVGDISRSKSMTVDWIKHAQSLTNKPVKGMLTGPVTILNWSFVRDDQPKSETCIQIALAIRDEVLDLEKAGIQIIQIDEAALREGLPLRKSQWKSYLNWATQAFRVSANGVKDETQIHTHMCYSEFNDIIADIASMDADVITIETSRSDMELLNVFEQFHYPNAIGPGVYDIHSPNIPTVDEIVNLMEKASHRIPAKRLWVNPDCGLKTRQWNQVKPALTQMVLASRKLRKKVSTTEIAS